MASIFSKIRTTVKTIRLFKNWHIFFLCYAGLLKKEDVVFTFRNGLAWHVDTTKRGFAVIADIWIQKPYALISTINNPKIVFDLGAHIGSFSLLAAIKHPQAQIYSFEASRENFALLKKNIVQNKLTNITAFNVGVSPKDQTLDFFINERNSVLNSFVKTRQPDMKGGYTVHCKSLKTIFEELDIKECDFLKIDIEGWELAILESAQQDKLLNKIRAVVMEIEPTSPDFQKAVAFLEHNGFSVTVKNDIISAVQKH